MITYTLKGKSIAQLRKEGSKFWSTWHNGEKFENEKGYKGKVSFDPDNLFLKDSNNKTLAEQKKMLPKGTFMGNAATYCELAFLHYKKTGKRLFGEDYDYNYTRTITETSEGHVAHVGDFYARDGLVVSHWRPDERLSSVFVAPLYRSSKEQIDSCELKLTQGKVALIDKEDFDFLSQWRWRYTPHHSGNSGYASRVEEKRTIYLHRVLLGDIPEGMQADHINQNKLDNRKSNLRIITPSENQLNKGIQKNNTSGTKGVSWDKRTNKWRVQKRINGVKTTLGYYTNKEDAVKVVGKSEVGKSDLLDVKSRKLEPKVKIKETPRSIKIEITIKL